MRLYGYQDIGGTWGPTAEEPVNRAGVPVKKRGVIRCWGGSGPGATRTRSVLTRGPPPAPAPWPPALPVRPPAACARFGAARCEQSAHNEALSDVAAVPGRPAGARVGGREGRSRLAPGSDYQPHTGRGATPWGWDSWPGAGAGGPRVRGGTGGLWSCRRRTVWGRALAESPLIPLIDQNSPQKGGSQEHKRPL